MATPDIKLTQLPSLFSWYSIDSPPPFAHLLIQSSDPVLKTTHVIGDTVQFETYPAPCIYLGTKWTALVDDNEARREYEAEFGVPGILPSTIQPPITFHLQLQNQIQRDCIRLPPCILSWEWFQDKLRTYCCLWLVIYLKMTHHMTKHDSWHSQWRHLENDYWWNLPCSFIWLIHFSHMTYPIAFLASFFPSLQTTFYF